MLNILYIVHFSCQNQPLKNQSKRGSKSNMVSAYNSNNYETKSFFTLTTKLLILFAFYAFFLELLICVYNYVNINGLK